MATLPPRHSYDMPKTWPRSCLETMDSADDDLRHANSDSRTTQQGWYSTCSSSSETRRKSCPRQDMAHANTGHSPPIPSKTLQQCMNCQGEASCSPTRNPASNKLPPSPTKPLTNERSWACMMEKNTKKEDGQHCNNEPELAMCVFM